MRVTLVISSLTGGGAERVMSLMANYWAATGWSVTLLTLDDGSEPPYYTLDSRVRHLPLGLAEESSNAIIGLYKNLRRVRALRGALRAGAPDAIISFVDSVNILTLMAARGLGTPVVISERVDPEVHRIRPLWERLRRRLYPHAQALVVQTEAVRLWAERVVRPEKVYVVPNPVRAPAPESEPPAFSLPPGFRIVAAGRLVPQKGFDLLLRAFARCAPEYPDWFLVILGEGPERAALENLAEELGIAPQVRMPGKIKEMEAVLRRADLFVLSSRFEGFPNVLCEAMACGLPVITTDCRSGPGVIVRDRHDGLLVPVEDVEALATAMRRLIGNEPERKRLGANATEIVARLSEEKVMKQWETLLLQIGVKTNR